MKPAIEPIVMAYKPGGKRGLSIDECRVRVDGDIGAGGRQEQYIPNNKNNVYGSGMGGGGNREAQPIGRWPANLCLSWPEDEYEGAPNPGRDEVLALFPRTKSGKPAGTRKAAHHFGTAEQGTELTGFGDSGSAARFFYQAKSNKRDRADSKHPTVKPQALMRWLVQLVTPPQGTVLDPFGGSGSTAQAALAVGRKPILIEREAQWFNDAVRRIEAANDNRPAATDAG